MKKYLQKKLNNEKGMTLIELLAVIVIIAIIAAIAIPAIGNLIQNSRENALVADAQNIMAAASVYFAENGEKSEVTAETLLKDKYLESTGEITTATVTKATPDKIVFSGDAGNEKKEIKTGVTRADLSEKGKEIFETSTSTTPGVN